MLKRVAVVGSLLIVASAMSSTEASAQYLPGQNSVMTSTTTRDLMQSLGYAPNDYCGSFFFQAVLPMCGDTPADPPSGDPGEGGVGFVSGFSAGTGAVYGYNSSGGSSSGGSSSGGSSSGGDVIGGGSSSGGSSSGGSSSGGSSSGGSSGGGVAYGYDDPFGGAGNMTTPEPISLILLGTGLAGIGGIRAVRRRRHDSED